MNKGEANTGYNVDQYPCTFAKMIQYWRQIWNERTNGTTDIQFPFGFVQVSFIHIYTTKKNHFTFSYQHLEMILQL
jgi:hypothetical protein